MKKKENLIQTACSNVAGFAELLAKFEQKVVVAGKSKSTLSNYARHLAKLAIHFNELPTQVDPDRINDYLHLVKRSHNTPSESYFKFTVYALRFAHRIEGMKDKRIELPTIKRSKKLPVVPSQEEVRRLLKAPKLLKHRVLIALLYGCGLRCFGVRNLKIADLDFDRKMLHVKDGKGKKDRYVPLADLLIRGIKTYLEAEQPLEWLFNSKGEQIIGRAGGDFDGRYSQRGVQWAVNEAKKKAGILKPMNVHTLRHTYATHLLEEGLDILTIKDLLGHECIDTTMVYLHVAQTAKCRAFSPLDRLYLSRK